MDVSGHRLDVLEVQFDSETAERAKTVSEFSSAWNLIPLTLQTNVSSETNVAADAPLRAGDILTVLTDEETIKKLRASGHWLLPVRVARTIPQPFSLNDVSVAVWKAHPEFFPPKP